MQPGDVTAPREVVLAFWAAMATNDFEAASRWLSDDYECLWPQSGERIVGRANFVAINANYPAHGRWVFDIRRIIAEHDEVVTTRCSTGGACTAGSSSPTATSRGDDLICGVHGWDYRNDTGVSAYNNDEALHRFTSWVDDGVLHVDLDEIEAAWERRTTRSPTTATPTSASTPTSTAPRGAARRPDPGLAAGLSKPAPRPGRRDGRAARPAARAGTTSSS
jgi:limonene-1,2-epoxide hydrolase